MNHIRRLIIPLLFFCGLAGHLVAQSITVSPWLMNRGVGTISLPSQIPFHGAPILYSYANIPATSDANWEAAPLNSSGQIFFSEGSGVPCLNAADFTYFQTLVNIPLGTTVTQFQVSFGQVDDGARAYIFNSLHPAGAFVSGGDIVLGGPPVSADLSSLVAVGEVNRVVIVQVDDCATQNNLKNALITVNGIIVPVLTCPTLSNETVDFSTCLNDQGQPLSVDTDDPSVDVEFVIFSSPQTDPYTAAGGTQLGTSVTAVGLTATSSTGISGLATGTYYAYAILDTDDADLTDPTCRPFQEIVITIDPLPTPTISGPTEYCEGTGGVTLDAGASYASYSWSPGGASTQMITAMAGNYSVTVTDANGCSGTSPSVGITEELDTENPVITCPNDLFVLFDPAICGAVVNYTPTATDNCNPSPTISTIAGPASGTVFPLGNTIVTVQADDGNGQTVTCDFMVMVGSVLPTGPDFVINDDAINTGGTCFQLTPAANNKNGSVWYQNKLTLSNDFCMLFDLNFGTKDGTGADGMAFVLQPINTGQGSLGGGIGYQGIMPSVTVEFDTWQNTQFADPSQDHIGIQSNGSTDHSTGAMVPPVTLPSNIEDGLDHTVRLDWDANTTTLDVYFDNVLRTSLTQDIVTTIFSGDAGVYWGWTGSTGGANNNQSVCISSVSFTEEPTIVATETDASCTASSDGAIDATISGGVAPYTISWSNGTSTEDLSGLPAGDYTITVTDNCGTVATETFTVGTTGTTPTPTISGLTEYCEGTGGVTLDAGAGYASYSWTPGGQSTQMIIASAESYSVTVTDANGCSGTSPDHVVTENANPVVAIFGDTEYCAGDDVTLDAGAGFDTYLWSTGESTQMITVGAGTYSVAVTNVDGCSATSADHVVTENALADAGDNNATTVCETTVVDLLTLVSVPGGTFSDPGSTGGLSGSDFNTTGLPVGGYDILYTVASGSGCADGLATITITVEENITEVCVINTYDTSNSDDHVFVFFDFPKVAGGQYLAARFVWEGAGGSLQTNPDGTATITGKVKLKQDPNVTFDVNILLENKMDWATWSGLGRIYAAKPATQAIASLEHVNWEYYEMSSASNMTACPGSAYAGDVINLTHKPIDYSMGFQVGFGANEKDSDKGIAGWFLASGTLGSTSYSNWGDMNADLDCSFGNCVDCSVDFTTVSSPEVCNSTGGGSITVNPSGGSGVYDYSDDGGTTWITGTGVTSLTFVNLSGMIELRVRDANNYSCVSDIRYVDLTGPSPDFTTSTVDASCADREDGSIDVNVSGGNGPFMFSINGEAFEGSGTTYTFTDLAPGDHSIQIQDANGCLSEVRMVTTGANLPPSFEVNVGHESAPGASDGSVAVTVTSGVPPFLFSSDNGATFVAGAGNGNIFGGLTIGIYDLLVQDGNGCVSSRLPALVSGAGFCPPSSLIDQVYEAHPGDPGQNAKFMCEDQSPQLLYTVQNLTGLQAFYFDWEVSGIQGKKVGDRPTVDGVTPATDGSVNGATNPVNVNTTYTFDANGKEFGLENNVNSERRISLAVQPYMINDDGTTCPANADEWKVYVYPRAEAALENAVTPGVVAVLESGDDPSGLISIESTTKINELKGLMIYDVHIDPNSAITELAAGLDLTDVGSVREDKEFEAIDLGLTSLTNTSGGAVTVSVEVTPKYDPDHARAADRDAVTNPNGYCPGETQVFDIIVNQVQPRLRNSVSFNGQNIRYRLYPNPTQAHLFIQASEVLEQAQPYEVLNLHGQHLSQGTIEAGEHQEKILVTHLPAGIYMIRLLNPQGKDAVIRFQKN